MNNHEIQPLKVITKYKFPELRQHLQIPRAHSQLSHVVQNLDLLARLESRKTEVRAARTAEGISKRTTTTRACLALDGEIQFVQVVRVQLQDVQVLVGVCATLFIFSVEAI